jgi:hypothetical protein
MALQAIDPNASVDASTAAVAAQISGLVAGEALFAGAIVKILAADGKVYLANGTAADVNAQIAGVVPRAAGIGQPVTVYGIGARFRYSSGLTPGAKLFLGTTSGRADTAATTGDAVGVFRVINDTDVQVIRMFT